MRFICLIKKKDLLDNVFCFENLRKNKTKGIVHTYTVEDITPCQYDEQYK